MNALFVLYDDTCGFCCRCAEWLSRQATFVPLAVLPASAAGLPIEPGHSCCAKCLTGALNT